MIKKIYIEEVTNCFDCPACYFMEGEYACRETNEKILLVNVWDEIDEDCPLSDAS